MSKPTAAELAEELARVDHEIKVVQIELEDAQFINDDFTRKIAAKVCANNVFSFSMI